MVDLLNQRVGRRNIETAFYEKDLYPDDLERELNNKVEAPGMQVFGKIEKSEDLVRLSRCELEKIQKYLLIQEYRNPLNISQYDPEWEGDTLGLNKVFLNGDENYKDHVFRMMQIILDTPWKDLRFSEEEEIRNNVQRTYTTSTAFVRTDGEFVINDLGHVTERFPWHPNLDMDEINRAFIKDLKSRGAEGTEQDFNNYINSNQFVDTFTFFPISANMGVIYVNGFLTQLFKLYKAFYQDGSGRICSDQNAFQRISKEVGIYSPFLCEHYLPCIQQFASKKMYEALADYDMVKYETEQSPADHYYYPMAYVDPWWSLYLNKLTINEAHRYFGFKDIKKGKGSIGAYIISDAMAPGAKNNLRWIDLDGDWTKPLI